MTLGQQLQSARTARSMSVEDAAHATKIRAGRILDIERDEYQNFPHMTYAKHFVVLYSRYLSVDPAPYLGDFDTSNMFDVEDYQYLKDTAPVARVRLPETRRRPKRIVAFAGASFVAFAGFFCWLTYLSVQRLGPLDSLVDRQKSPKTEDVENKAVPIDVSQSPEEILAEEPTRPAVREMTALSDETSLQAVPQELLPDSNASAQLPAPDAAPAVALPAPAPEVVAAKPASAVESDEVVVSPLKPTWVTVIVNESGARPAFHDFLKPGDAALRFKGHKFWVFIDDISSVEVRKNSEIYPLTARNTLIR